MANSAHMALRAAVVQLLLAPPAMAGGRVVANRKRPMAEQDASQVFVYLEESTPERGAINGAPVDWSTRLRIECVARPATPDSAETVADALATQAWTRLQADTTLGGLCGDLASNGIAWTEDESNATLSACQLLFTATHRTTNLSLETPA